MLNFSEFFVSWEELKNLSQTKNLKLNYEILNEGIFKIYTVQHNNKYFTILYDPSILIIGKSNNNDQNFNDFVTNYKNQIDLDPPYFLFPIGTPDIGKFGNKLQVHHSSRPDSFNKRYFSVWTSSGDNITTRSLYEGNVLYFTLNENENEKIIDVTFDPLFGETWIKQGYGSWKNCGNGVYLTISIFGSPTLLQTQENLHLVLEGNRVKFSPNGPNTGTHGFAGTPVLIPNKSLNGYWDYSVESGLKPNLNSTGKYDIYTVESEVLRLLNKVVLIGDNNSYFELESDDIANLNYPYFVRAKINNFSNVNCIVSLMMSLYRETT